MKYYKILNLVKLHGIDLGTECILKLLLTTYYHHSNNV